MNLLLTGFVTVACLCSGPNGLQATPVQERNLDRLEQCARAACDTINAVFNGGDSVCLNVAPHPAAWLLQQSYVTAAHDKNLYPVLCAGVTPAFNSVSPAINDIGVEYSQTDDQDFLQRTVYLSLSATITAGKTSGNILSVRKIHVALTDTIPADQALLMDDPDYAFAKGVTTAKPKPGFWEKIVEPAVVVGSAVVMVVLLFTVRSQ